jgi:hypothetical protein
MRLADAEAILQECKNRAEPLLTIDDFSNRLLCFGMNVLPDKDLGDRFSSKGSSPSGTNVLCRSKHFGAGISAEAPALSGYPIRENR